MDFDEVSLGEVNRTCERIEKAVMEQNGRLTALEKDATQIKTLWSVAVIVTPFVIEYIRHRLVGGS